MIVLICSIMSLAIGVGSETLAQSAQVEDDVCSLEWASAPSEPRGYVYGSIGSEFIDAARASSISNDKFLNRFIADYSASAYSAEEIVATLRDLLRMPIESGRILSQVSDQAKGKGSTVCSRSGGTGEDDLLILFVDPVCGYCHEVTERILALKRACPNAMPNVALQLAPSKEVISQQAGLFLRTIQVQSPELFCSAVLDSMANVRENDSEALELFKEHYSKLLGEQIQQVEQADVAPYPDATPPFALYKGQFVKRFGMFNPFATETEILYAIAVGRSQAGSLGECNNKERNNL